MLSLALSGSALTRFGQTHWQSAREMKANGFFGAPGTGFILGKLGTPGSRANYICSKVFPHALIVAPKFDRERFPSRRYHRGGVQRKDRTAAPPACYKSSAGLSQGHRELLLRPVHGPPALGT